MRGFIKVPCTIVVALFVLGVVNIVRLNAQELYKEDLLFYASFDGAVEPGYAIGSKEALGTKSPVFVEGKRGKGILIGTKESSVGYKAKGNINLEEGTISMWINPVGWNPGREVVEHKNVKNHHFFGSSDGTFMIYQWEGDITLKFWVWPSAQDYYAAVTYSHKVWKSGEWSHLAATWKKGVLSLFLNGKLEDIQEDVPPLRFGEEFYLGGYFGTTTEETGFDELRIFKRALSEDEIKSLIADSNK